MSETSSIAVTARGLAEALAELRGDVPQTAYVRVVGHDRGKAGHRQTIAVVLRELHAFWGNQRFGIFNKYAKHGEFVQSWLSSSAASVYGEAADPRAYQNGGHLSDEGRQLLASLGWHDPKTQPYQPSEFEWLWDQNFAREWPLAVEEIAADLARTLHLAYAVNPSDDLRVKLQRCPETDAQQSRVSQTARVPLVTPTICVAAASSDLRQKRATMRGEAQTHSGHCCDFTPVP